MRYSPFIYTSGSSRRPLPGFAASTAFTDNPVMLLWRARVTVGFNIAWLLVSGNVPTYSPEILDKLAQIRAFSARLSGNVRPAILCP
jgi:hypothetical protein